MKRPVGRHRVEAVGHDQEVRGQREVGELRAVIARAVVALPVVLDRLRLRGREPEALEEAGGEARSPTDGGPLGVVQLAGLAEDGRVDRDLAEVVKPSGPPEARSLGAGEAQPVGQLAHVLGDAQGMPMGARVALVDDVGERFQRHRHLAPQPAEAPVDLVEQEQDGSEGGNEPEVLQGGEREQERRGPLRRRS